MSKWLVPILRGFIGFKVVGKIVKAQEEGIVSSLIPVKWHLFNNRMRIKVDINMSKIKSRR